MVDWTQDKLNTNSLRKLYTIKWKLMYWAIYRRLYRPIWRTLKYLEILNSRLDRLLLRRPWYNTNTLIMGALAIAQREENCTSSVPSMYQAIRFHTIKSSNIGRFFLNFITPWMRRYTISCEMRYLNLKL